MATKFDHARKDILNSGARQEILDPQHIISLLPLRPYHVVADVGCGSGFFAVPLGKYLFDGKVYAIDVQQEMLDSLKERLAQVNLGNVEPVLSAEDKLPIGEGVLDGALMAFVLHETENKEGFLKEVLSHLCPGGWAAILDWYKKEMDDGPRMEKRVSEEDAWKLAEKVGFRFVSQRNLNGKHYMLLLRR